MYHKIKVTNKVAIRISLKCVNRKKYETLNFRSSDSREYQEEGSKGSRNLFAANSSKYFLISFAEKVVVLENTKGRTIATNKKGEGKKWVKEGEETGEQEDDRINEFRKQKKCRPL